MKERQWISITPGCGGQGVGGGAVKEITVGECHPLPTRPPLQKKKKKKGGGGGGERNLYISGESVLLSW